LAKDYLVNPQVSLSIVEFAKRRFTVLGEVQRPGAYDLPEDQSLNLLQAISMAGGYTRIAAPGKVTVQRQEGEKRLIFPLDAKAMSKDKNIKVFEILPEDTITVGESIF
jgi:polysaccharide export outer membrane protein